MWLSCVLLANLLPQVLAFPPMHIHLHLNIPTPVIPDSTFISVCCTTSFCSDMPSSVALPFSSSLQRKHRNLEFKAKVHRLEGMFDICPSGSHLPHSPFACKLHSFMPLYIRMKFCCVCIEYIFTIRSSFFGCVS